MESWRFWRREASLFFGRRWDIPLQEWLIKPYSKSALISEMMQIFNYCQSRARRVIENSFGILVLRWRISRQLIEASPEKVEKYTLAAIALHNYLCQTDTSSYTASGFIHSEDSSGKVKQRSWRGFSNMKELMLWMW